MSIVYCKGCLGEFVELDINDNGYCESCQYESDAKADNLTGAENE